MLKKFGGTNEAEPRKQCESLARARVTFSMFLATLVISPVIVTNAKMLVKSSNHTSFLTTFTKVDIEKFVLHSLEKTKKQDCKKNKS